MRTILASTLALALVAGPRFSTAQTTASLTDDIDYAILLSISEEVEIAERYGIDATVRLAGETAARRHQQAAAAMGRPAAPIFEGEAGELTPELSKAIQTATAQRLRGETVAAAASYARVLELSREPIHAFFYAEVARANGDVRFASYLSELYASARAAGALLPEISQAEERDIRIAGVVTDAGTGAMVAGAEVRVIDPLSHREFVASTDANGLFVVDGVSRGANVRIATALAGYVTSEDALYIDPAHTVHAPMVGTRVYLQRDDAGGAYN